MPVINDVQHLIDAVNNNDNPKARDAVKPDNSGTKTGYIVPC